MSAAAPTERTVKCQAGLDTGQHERDNISVTSPSGNHRSVWLHKEAVRALEGQDAETWSTLLGKFYDGYKHARETKWQRRLEVEAAAEGRGVPRLKVHETPEWAQMLRQNREDFGTGLYAFYVELTLAEMELIDRVSDQKVDRHAGRGSR